MRDKDEASTLTGRACVVGYMGVNENGGKGGVVPKTERQLVSVELGRGVVGCRASKKPASGYRLALWL